MYARPDKPTMFRYSDIDYEQSMFPLQSLQIFLSNQNLAREAARNLGSKTRESPPDFARPLKGTLSQRICSKLL